MLPLESGRRTNLFVFCLLLLTSPQSPGSYAHADALVRLPVVADSTSGVDLRNVTVVGEWAYCSIGSGLQVMDISDPSAPQFVARVELGNPRPSHIVGHFRVVVQGDYAYLPDWEEGIYVIDISDPTQPQVAGQFETLGLVRSIMIQGSYLYVAGVDRPLLTLHLSDPTHATVVDSVLSYLVVADFCIVGDYLYAAADFLYTFDISDPSHPVHMHTHTGPARAHSVTSQGTFLYVADWWYWLSSGLEGIGVFDITSPGLPLLVGTNPRHANDMDAVPAGHLCYIAHANGGLHVADISDPAHPYYLNCYDVGAPPACGGWYEGPYQNATSVTLLDGYVYMSDALGLFVYTLQDRGDINGDQAKNAADIILLVNYVFKSGPPPNPVQQGDTDCKFNISSADIIHLVNHVFKSSAPLWCP